MLFKHKNEHYYLVIISRNKIFCFINYNHNSAMQERVEMERQQAIRDILLKRDVARWLQAKMIQIEQGLGSEPQNKVTGWMEG